MNDALCECHIRLADRRLMVEAGTAGTANSMSFRELFDRMTSCVCAGRVAPTWIKRAKGSNEGIETILRVVEYRIAFTKPESMKIESEAIVAE